MSKAQYVNIYVVHICILGPPARCPSHSFFGWEGSRTKIDY